MLPKERFAEFSGEPEEYLTAGAGDIPSVIQYSGENYLNIAGTAAKLIQLR